MRKKSRGLFKYALRYKKTFVLTVICSLLSGGLTLLGPVLTGEGIDRIISAGNVDFDGLKLILLGFFITTAVVALSQRIMGICINKLCYNAAQDMREEAFLSIAKAKIKYIDATSHGDLLSRVINDTETVCDGMMQFFNQFFIGVVTIAGTLGVMFAINYLIALVVLLLTPLSLCFATFIAKRSYKMFREQAEIFGDMTGYINERILNQKTVKAFCMERDGFSGYREKNARLQKVGFKAQFYSALTNPCTRFINGLVYAAVGILGAYFCIKYGQEVFSVGMLTVFLTYANQYTKPFNEITGVVTQLQNAAAASDRIREICSKEKEREDGEELQRASGEVGIENLSFSYDADRPLIENFNLQVKKGQKVAIVGPTGCGKTTLINLLMRFYEPLSGKIYLDNIPAERIKLEDYRKQFGMVLQDTFLSCESVADNIRYANREATKEEVVRAAKEVYADNFIAALPEGYDTVLKEGGGELSQGERQLLCIARVMLSNPPILILDEATSNVDTRTEIKIQRAFDRLMKGRTIFVVAHRLSTIVNSDLILVMNKGNIVEQGTHAELLEKRGFYYKLYSSQFDRE